MKPSQDYFPALEANRRHHARGKTFSGKLFRPHARFVKEIIDRLDCRSVLDYGAGKGRQYEWVNRDPTGSIPVGMTIEQWWGVPVAKYDPAYPPFAAEPAGTFDLVVCTHTLGRIPIADLDWVIDRLFDFAGKAIYVAEKIGDAGEAKKMIGNTDALPFGWTVERWQGALTRNTHVEITLTTRIIDDRGGKITSLMRLKGGEWSPVEWFSPAS